MRLSDGATAADGDADFLRRAAAFVYVDDLSFPQPSDDDQHHLLHVLRLRAGEVVAAADGVGSFVPCVLREGIVASRGKGRSATALSDILEVVGPVRKGVQQRTKCVAFAVPKGERSEWTVQKLTEIGVDHIVPLLTERTVVRLDERDSARRAERFRRIAREAGVQSRQLYLPLVDMPMTLEECLHSLSDTVGQIAIAEPGGGPVTSDVGAVLIGPEGGWSDAELAEVDLRVGLGSGVLRTETAAVVAGTLLLAVRSGLIA